MHTRPFLELEALHLTLAGTEIPPAVFWQRLGVTLQAATKLRDLRLGFDQYHPTPKTHGIWYTHKDAGNWYVPLWKLFGSHVWSELKSLRLDGLHICEAGLIYLLTRHHSSLNHLDLCNICIEHGSFQSLLSRIRSTLSLKHFQIWGVLFSRRSPHENWFLPPTPTPNTNRYPGMDYY